jgi:RNA polymerase sigma factor (sigma-70 family)
METTIKRLTEDRLIALIEARDESAIAELLERYKSKFYTAAYLLVKDRYIAEDLFQESCIKIINSIRAGKYNEDGKFLPWALRITRNVCFDYLRVAKRTTKVTLPDGQDIFELLDIGDSNIEDQMIRNQSGDKVKKMLEQIPYEQREVIVLRLFGDLSFKEIAELTQVGINTALGRMRYGLLNLRRMVEEKNIVL